MVDVEKQRQMLYTMQTIRKFELRMQELFADAEIPGFLHLYIGEEAIATGVCQALSEDDYIASTHRGHGHGIARGLNPERMVAELYGKETGYCNGKGGSMHIADVDAGMLGANGVVGAGIPISAGAALSAKLRDTDEVAVAFFGDGAISQGAFHETLNLAAIWDLPLICVVENNQYGEMSGLDEHHPEATHNDLTVFGDPYGIARDQVDGMDVEAVNQVAEEAVEHARSGGGPTIIECVAYRFEGHHEGDAQFYREEKELSEWREKDPVTTYSEKLITNDAMTEAEYETMEADIETEIQKAVEFARESEYPDPKAAYEGLYVEEGESQ